MQKSYEEALTAFGIKSGFVNEQVEGFYQSLMTQYNPDIFEFLSPEYCQMNYKKHQLTMDYFWLREPFPHYIVNQNSNLISGEQMIEEISKSIYDYGKSGREVDNQFIAQLVETLVSFKGLHQYVKDIEFRVYSKDSIADYSRNGTLTIYEHKLQNHILPPDFLSSTEKNCYPYYRTVSIIRHEVEHACEDKKVDQNANDIYSFLWKACDVYEQKNDELFSHIVTLPSLIFEIASAILKIKFNMQGKKYVKNWSYCPEERMAEICANSLVLDLLDQTPNVEKLKNMRSLFKDEIIDWLFFGYDKPLGPTDFYLSQLKQYKDCLQLLELAKSLTLEERLLLGLKVANDELEEAKANKEKILSAIRKIC